MRKALLMVAEFMAVAAKTAPKALGQDCVGVKVITGEDINYLADEMERYGNETGKENFDRDAESIRRSEAVVFVYLADNKPLGLNCGACGRSRCEELAPVEGPEFAGPLCAWRLLDVGIAVGSAAKTAAVFNVDNRVMYRPAVVARKAGLVGGSLAIAIPISATSKNIYFDR